MACNLVNMNSSSIMLNKTGKRASWA